MAALSDDEYTSDLWASLWVMLKPSESHQDLRHPYGKSEGCVPSFIRSRFRASGSGLDPAHRIDGVRPDRLLWGGSLLLVSRRVAFPRGEEEVGLETVLAGIELMVAPAGVEELLVG